MTRKSKRKLGRIKRGDNIAPGRYWLNFMVFSLVVHTVTLTLMSDVALSFIQSLRKPEPPAGQPMYVSLLYTAPAPLPQGEAPRSAAPAKAPALPAPVRAAVHARPPDEHVKLKADTQTGSPSPPSHDEDALRVKISGVTKARNEKEPRTVAEHKPLDTAIRETAVLESVEPGTVELITGTKKTTLELKDIAKHKPDQAGPPVVLNRYSSVRISSAAPAPSASQPSAVKPDYPAATAMAPKQLDNLAQPVQPATLDRKAGDTPPVPAFTSPLANVSSAANNIPVVMQPGEKAPLSPSPATGFKLHTSIPPSTVAVPGNPPAGNDQKTNVMLAAQPVKPIAEPAPSHPKVITIEGSAESAGRPPKIKIITPREGIIDKSLVDIAGEVEGDTVKSVSLSIRGEKRELLVRGGVFKTTAQLEEGKNEIKAVASDLEGRAASDSIAVTYVPAITAARISFVSPVKDGVIDATTTNRLAISGVVEGKGIGTVRVYLNKTVMDIEVKDGRFSETAPLEAEQNLLYAEATDKSGKTCRSEKIAFHVLNLYPKDLTVRMEFSGSGSDPGLKYRFKPHPLSEKTGQPRSAPEFFVDAVKAGGAVTVGEAAPGIYTVGVEYDNGPGEVQEATFKVTLYGYDPSRKKTRTIGPVKLRGKGYLPAVRVLLPEGVFWEDDSWFTGRMESGQGTMKYREPGGIVWTEEE
jgi:hypothetical protein